MPMAAATDRIARNPLQKPHFPRPLSPGFGNAGLCPRGPRRVRLSATMSRIARLLLGAVVPPFLISLAVLTFIVFLRELGRLSELLVTHNAALFVIGWVGASLLPPVLVFSLPMSYLIGILIGLSGLSGES